MPERAIATGAGVGLVGRAWARAGRISTRAGQRLRGLPDRWAATAAGPPIPPPRLMHLVAGSEDVGWFLRSGVEAAHAIKVALARHGRWPEASEALLDFGCGVGRVLRHWSYLDGPEVHGTDYNPALVAWCRQELPFARLATNAIDGPLAYPEAKFDLVYALSVFTHLSEPLQGFWMAELRRVLKPGGVAFLTTHGDYYRPQLSADDRGRYDAGELVVVKADRDGSNCCAAFHPEAYARGAWSAGFEVLDFLPEGAAGNPRQDVWLLRRPG